MIIDGSTLDPTAAYKLLSGSIVPRAIGWVMTVKAIYELERTSGRYALVTMCIGGGQGIAAIFERL
jgi:Thiolase, C-terminal domain